MTSETDSGCNWVPAAAGDEADAGVMAISDATAAGIRTFNTCYSSYVCLYVRAKLGR